LQGDTGATGSQGATGPQGATGATGATGAEGGTTTLTTKGDLLTRDSSAVARLGVGVTDDSVLMVRSSEATGLAWGSPRLAGGAARVKGTPSGAGTYLSGSGLVMDGSGSGNYAFSSDSVALSITGDIDIKVKMAMNDWTPAGAQAPLGKWTGTTGRSYQLFVNTDGTINLQTNPTGGAATTLTATSTVAPTVSNGDTLWVRATMDVDDGASQRVNKFYTSTDGTSWTQLGTTITTAGATSISDSSSGLTVGSETPTARFFVGTIFRTIIQSAYDTADNTSSLAYDANFETAPADAFSFTESSANSATVTIFSTRAFSFGLPNCSFFGSSTATIAANIDQSYPFQVTSPISVSRLGFEVTSAPASNSSLYVALYSATNDLQPTGSPIVSWATITLTTGVTGRYLVDITPTTLQSGVYILAVNPSVAFTARTFQTSIQMAVTSGANVNNKLTRSRTAGTFSTAESWNTRTVGAASGGFSMSFLLQWDAA
jgi:hypothetical protein